MHGVKRPAGALCPTIQGHFAPCTCIKHTALRVDDVISNYNKVRKSVIVAQRNVNTYIVENTYCRRLLSVCRGAFPSKSIDMTESIEAQC